MLLKKEKIKQMIFNSSLGLGLEDVKGDGDENVSRFWTYVMSFRAYEDVIVHDGVIEVVLMRPMGEKTCGEAEIYEVINRINSELHYGGAISYDKEKNEIVVRDYVRIYDGLYEKPISRTR